MLSFYGYWLKINHRLRVISDCDESRGQVKCDRNNLPLCFSVLRFSFLPILSQYDRLNQSTNYTADMISIANITTTLNGKNLMFCIPSNKFTWLSVSQAQKQLHFTFALFYTDILHLLCLSRFWIRVVREFISSTIQKCPKYLNNLL